MGPVRTARAPRKDGYHHGDLRNALLQTALRLVAKRGPEGFSLREAAREVGVSPGAAYRHFADKSALLSALAADGHVRMADAMERALARVPGEPGTGPHAVASFVALGAAYVEFAVAHAQHFQVMFGPCQDFDAAPPCSTVTGRDSYQILVDVLDALVAARVVAAEAREGAEIAAWATVHGLATLQLDGGLDLPAPARAQAVAGSCRLLLAGMGCPRELLPQAAPLHADPRPEARSARRPA